MRSVAIAALVVAAAGAAGGGLIAARNSTTSTAPNAATCSIAVTPDQAAADIAQAIVAAPDGTTICMGNGSYPPIHVVGAAHRAYVTIRPAPGATVTVAGMEVQNSSFLRFQGLHMTAGFNMRDWSTAASHDYQFVEDSFENAAYGIVLYGGSGPIKRVLIAHNQMRDIDFAGPACAAGYAGGQAVTIFYAEGVVIAHNTFKEVSWHYIQGGSAGPLGVLVTHNLFEGPIPAGRVACTHLNVWQIWQGGVNDTFSDNIVRGTPGHPAAITPILFETGPGGASCGDAMRNTTISNNLFVDDAAAYSIQVMTTRGLTVTHNTVVGSTYGTIVYRTKGCPNGTRYRVAHNIDVQNSGNADRSPDMLVGACRGRCAFDHNVSGDATAARARGARHYVVGWRPSWVTTAWNPEAEPSPPAGYYLPRGLPFAAGYAGGGGP
jgi:hypothetical protein